MCASAMPIKNRAKTLTGTHRMKRGATLGGTGKRAGVSDEGLRKAGPKVTAGDNVSTDDTQTLDGSKDAFVPSEGGSKANSSILGRAGMLGKGGMGGGMGGAIGGAISGMGGQRVSVDKTPGYAALSDGLKSRVDSLSQDMMSEGSMMGLINSKGFGTLSEAQRSKMLDVFQATGPKSRFHLGQLGQREVDGKPALLDKASDGRPLVDHMHDLAKQTPAAEFKQHGISKQELLDSAIEEIADPGAINQSARGTCTVTSMQHMLTSRNPAEYARIMKGLTSEKGSVTLRNGDTIDRDEGSVAQDSAIQRSHTERVFQSSMMEYSNGSGSDYSNRTDKSTRTFFGKLNNNVFGEDFRKLSDKFLGTGIGRGIENSGLGFPEMRRGMSGLFGDRTQVATSLSDLKDVKRHGAVLALKWSNDGASAHAVTFDRIEGDRVYFRNPWGREFKANGSEQMPPPRRTEESFSGLESMSLADAEKHFFGAVF